MDATDLFERARSHAQRLGVFERAHTHEPKNAPGRGYTWVAWVQGITPLAGRSGLNATSVRVLINVRLYAPILQSPQDAVDPDLVAAADKLMAAYSGDYTLDGAVAEVDLLGAYGIALEATAGYLEQDGKMFRIITITLPLIVNDLWTQAP